MAAPRNDLLSALSDLDNSVIELSNVVRRGKDPVDINEIRSELAAFVAQVDAVKRMVEVQEDDGSTDSEPRGEEDEESDDKGQSRDFSEFFATVAESVVDAQKQLDLKSTEYIQYQNELARQSKSFQPFPSFFRIPKVSADFKFAMEAQKSRRVGLIFFSDTTRASSRHQQSIQFEIASVPPSPELIEQLRREEPQLELVLSPGTRQQIYQVIESVSPDSAAAEKEKQMLLAEENRDRVLILAAEQQRSYFLLYANEAELKLLGVWQLVVDPETARLLPIYKYNRAPAPGEELAPFKEFVLSLADRQSAFLMQFSKQV